MCVFPFGLWHRTQQSVTITGREPESWGKQRAALGEWQGASICEVAEGYPSSRASRRGHERAQVCYTEHK